MIRKCKLCGNKFELSRPWQKYCSVKCRNKNRYLKNKEYFKNNAKEWARKNPEKRRIIEKRWRKEHRREQYLKHKDKNNSRNYTKYLRQKGIILQAKFCKKCLSKERLEVHHEVYPLTMKGIIQAVKENKIYYLCKDCHVKEDIKKYAKS